jgi:serine phosphatase RsbU (regulator of sigma subunit)
VCDSTGHGVPGAFMSLLNSNYLNEAINDKGIDTPSDVFNYVRKRLIDNIGQEGAQDGMDATLIKLTGLELSYAAAYNAPLLIRNSKIVECKYDKMPVGKGESILPFTNYQVTLQKGDMLFMYTDGFADQFGGPKSKKFKYAQFQRLLLSLSSKPSMFIQAELERTFTNWKGDLEQVDDICIVGIRI